jgi:curved DNA-binding protein CbpA
MLFSEQSQEIDNTHYYEMLELSKNASQDEIKKQYRELAKKYHPDRPTGNAAKVSLVLNKV